MKYDITVKIDAVFESNEREGMFKLSMDRIEEAADIIKNLASEILSINAKEINEEFWREKIREKTSLEMLYYGKRKYSDEWLDSGFKSDIGKVRNLDEDSIVIVTVEINYGERNKRSSLFVLGDGVGGHARGEVASYLGTKSVAEHLVELMLSISEKTETEIENSIKNSIIRANRVIYDHVKIHPEFGGMATTLVAALITDKKLFVGNVGDSRAYIINDGIRQITRDHSVVQEMVAAGKITKEEARIHPQKNVVTRVVGYYQDINVDVFKENIHNKDILMLCCDGLSDVLRDEEIKDVIINNQKNFSNASDDLVRIANERGGPDNISVIISRSNDLPGKYSIPETGKYPFPEPSNPPKLHKPIIDSSKHVMPVAFAIIATILLIFIIYIYFLWPPDITIVNPSESNVNTTTGMSQNFSIDINQVVTVSWYVNETEEKKDPDVRTSFYNNTSAMLGSWNVTAVASNSKGKATNIWNWNVLKSPEILTTIKVSPQSITKAVNEYETFKAETLDQSDKNIEAPIKWDSSNKQVGIIIENGLFTALAEGTTNITASSGKVSGNATVFVIAKGQTPIIMDYSPTQNIIRDFYQKESTFEIDIDSIVNVTWYINGRFIKSENNTNQSKMFNRSQPVGTWNVTAEAYNSNGSTKMTWTWIIS